VSGADGPLVLIADNEPAVAALLAEVLRLRGIRTETVGDGAQALRRIDAGDVALLVCDLMMPGRNGREVVAALAGRSHAPAIVVVSGHLDPATAAELAQQPGVAAVFAKPFDLFAFAGRVGELLRATPGPAPEQAGAS
jgi:CheY-like chemotaxis protein